MTSEPVPFEWRFCPICATRLVPRDDGERKRPHCTVCRRFYYLNPIPAVCCFITRHDEILLAKRAIEPCRGEWCLPGGFIEMGETTEEAVVRELREETGLTVAGLRLIGASTQQSRYYGAVTVLGYVAERWSGEPRPDTDAMDLRFFGRQERPPLPFTAHRELMALFDVLPQKT